MAAPRITAQSIKVLAALLDAKNDISGMDIIHLTQLPSGTVYPILMRLKEAGWVTSRWEKEAPAKLGRPRRKFYRLTPEGRKRGQAAFSEIRKTMGWKR